MKNYNYFYYLKLSIINLVFISNILLFNYPAFSKELNIEIDFASKYCDSKEKKFFDGLEDEKELKYQFFFNSIKINDIKNKKDLLSNIFSEIEVNCQYILSENDKKEIYDLIKILLSNKEFLILENLKIKHY